VRDVPSSPARVCPLGRVGPVLGRHVSFSRGAKAPRSSGERYH
jgi:hypothetical protein